MTDLIQRPTDTSPANRDFDFSGATITELDELLATPVAGEESKKKKQPARFNLIQMDRRWVVITVMVLDLAILSSSIAFSFNQIVAMSAWMFPPDSVRWLPAIFIDGPIIALTMARAVLKYRGVQAPMAKWLPLAGIIWGTGMSVIANAAHVVNGWEGDVSSMEAIIGVGFACSIPLIAWLTTEVLILLAFIDPDEAKAVARKSARDEARERAKDKKVGVR